MAVEGDSPHNQASSRRGEPWQGDGRLDYLKKLLNNPYLQECPLQEEITRDAAKLAREIEEAGPSQADGTHNWQQDLQRMRDTSDKSLLCLGWIHQIENAFEHFTTSAASPREASIAAHWTLRYLWNDFVQKRDAAQRGRGPYVAREVSEETMLDFMVSPKTVTSMHCGKMEADVAF